MSLRQGPISAPRARGDAPEGVVERVPLRLPGETGVEAQRGGREEKGGRKRGKGKGRERERWRTGNGERRRKGRDGESGTGKGEGEGEMGNRERGIGDGEPGTGSGLRRKCRGGRFRRGSRSRGSRESSMPPPLRLMCLRT